MYSHFGTTQLVPLNGASSQSKTPGLKKYATLSPYITEIQQKRKKTRSVLRENRCKSRNKHENSSKSFRIKQKSASSLHDTSIVRNKRDQSIKHILELVNKATSNQKTQNTLNIKRNVSKDQKQKQYSNIKHNMGPKQQSISKRQGIIKEISGVRNSRNEQLDNNREQIKYFNSKREKGSKRQRKQLSFRKNMYETQSRLNFVAPEKEKQTIDVCKHGYTDQNRNNSNKNEDVKKVTAELIPEKKKFRRNKYQALYSSVNSNQAREEKARGAGNDPAKSQSQLQLAKKQSNVSINKQMDKLAENQIRKFYRQMRSKQIEKSVEKSTEKYFRQESSYRALKSNNDIQIYVSTVKNPSANRKSNASTLNTSDQYNQASMVSNRKPLKQNNYLQYEFDFRNQENHAISGITEMQNASEEESMHMIEQQTSFQRQRRQVEREFFNKQSPQVEWSDEDCQIDEV